MKDIKLIPLEKNHIELVRRWRNSPEVADYMYTDDIISEAQQKKWYEKIKLDSTSRYWIIEYDDKLLGLASITDISKTLNSCYWAFYLGDTSVRGAGIGAKVEYHILKYVFEELKLNKLRCEVFEINDRVVKMHEGFGFRRESFYREHCYKNGSWQNVVGLAILKKEWESLKNVIHKRVYG